MKTLIIFYPYNNLAVDQLSVIEILKKKYKIILLTIEERGSLHKAASDLNVTSLSIFNKNNYFYNIIKKKKILISKIIYYIYLFYKFPKIILKHRAKYVFAHLEVAGLVSSFYEKFLNFKSFYFRHSADANLIEGNYRSKIINKLVNFISNDIICVSSAVKNHLIKIERVNPKKITQIDYGYNFNLHYKYKSYKKKYKFSNSKTINLITIGRLVDLKRHILIFKLMNKLKNSNKNYNLVCLGSGSKEKELKNFIKINRLKNIEMFGFKKNILDYLMQSDILIHFSKSESFGHVVLEAALLKKTVLVCKNVGIFNSLINDKFNGFLVSKNNPINESLKILNTLTKKKAKQLGLKLHKSIIKKYHINNFERKYLELLK